MANKKPQPNAAHYFVEYRKAIPDSFPKVAFGTSMYKYLCVDCVARLRQQSTFLTVKETKISREQRRGMPKMPQFCQNDGCKGKEIKRDNKGAKGFPANKNE